MTDAKPSHACGLVLVGVLLVIGLPGDAVA